MYDFSVLKQAGILPGTTAKIVGVSRVTASHWHNGHTQPHHLLGNKVHQYLDLVRSALEKGLLPLRDNPNRRGVADAIAKALIAAKA